MLTTVSKDGTVIAYERTGQGPAIALVNGALTHRKFYGEEDLAALLAPEFTVTWFDRRGRGDSTDTTPYSVQREIEDIEALIDEAGGRACLYGCSSGAALALLAAARIGPQKITRLAIYEPPYSTDSSGFAEGKQRVNGLITAGKPGAAVTAFMEIVGTPPDQLKSMQQSPDWAEMERLGHTLAYDYEVLGDGTIPADAKNVEMPTLVMAGEKGGDAMQAAAARLEKIIPRASLKILKGQTHLVSPEALAPALISFFA